LTGARLNPRAHQGQPKLHGANQIVPRKIQIIDGRILAGSIELRPSHHHWRRKRAWWRAWRGGKPLSEWCLTPELALAAAERFSSQPRA
jgi:hypothetical protein